MTSFVEQVELLCPVFFRPPLASLVGCKASPGGREGENSVAGREYNNTH